ncbi:MAG: ATP-binding protein [Peptoniphilaceae bacterium]|nr:ATP-binding protein [Peptoniphilaceae bacterium]MDY6018193.1 ATP-binding protein [Anaerococcus sp.]
MSSKQKVSDILEQRRKDNQKDLENRINEIYKNIPQISYIDKRIKELGFSAVSLAFKDGETKAYEEKIKELSQKKKNLLVENGYPKDYLEMHYHCNICKDTGFVGNKVCICRKQLSIEEKYSQSNIRDVIMRENFSTFNINLFSKNKYFDYGVSPFSNIEYVIKDVKKYIENFQKERRNIYIFGDVGRGKTFLINSIAKELLDRNFSVIYLTATKLFRFMNDYLYAFSERKEALQDKYDLIFTCDLLIIDDLGAEAGRDSDKANLFDIVNERINAEKPIIFSSNFDEDGLKEIYEERVFSRIIGSSTIYEIFGEDLRLKDFS